MQKRADASSLSLLKTTPAKHVANTAIYRKTGVVAKPWARSPSEPKFQQRHICTLQYVANRQLQSVQTQHTHISSHVASSIGMEVHVNALSLFKKPPTTCLILIFWHMAPCSLVDGGQRFRRTTAGISRQARTLKMETAGEIITPQPTVREVGGFYKRWAPIAYITPVHDFQVTSPSCFNSHSFIQYSDDKTIPPHSAI